MALKSKLLLMPLAAGALSAVGIAFAAWTSDGTGSATARATSSVDSEIAAGTTAADLFPGAAKTVTVSVSNPNDYPVVVNSIASGASALVNGSCAAGTVTTEERPHDGAGLLQSNGSSRTIAPGGSGTYTLTTRMLASAVDACKSQTFSLALSATVSSSA
ncbi:MAG: hypothetical protein M3N68_11115 [Actinomycetota bacterium]|nr:hypothetical protein [Actinomycetota bacterium]